MKMKKYVCPVIKIVVLSTQPILTLSAKNEVGAGEFSRSYTYEEDESE